MPSHLKIIRKFRNYFEELLNNTYATYEIQKIKEYYPNHILFKDVEFKNNMLSSNELLIILENLSQIIDDDSYKGYGRREKIEKLYREFFGKKK